MDLVLELGFVDRTLLESVETPDWDAVTKAIPESVPWREQDHSVGRSMMVEDREAPSDMLAIPGRAKRRQQAKARALERVRKGSVGKEAAAAIAAAERAAVLESERERAAMAAAVTEEGGVKRERGRRPGVTAAKKTATAGAASGGEEGAAAAPKKRGRKPKGSSEQQA